MTYGMRTTGINLCPQPTPLFVGREEPVQQGVRYLLNNTTQRKVFLIHGLGGAGKTQMAFRIVEKTREHWSDIVFADATSVTTLETTLSDFARRKGIGHTYEDTLHWLESTPTRWLLVMDNADDRGIDITRYLPESSNGHIIITTRDRELLELVVGYDSACDLPSMEPREGLQLLLKASRRENEELAENEMRAAKRLLEVRSISLLVRTALIQYAGLWRPPTRNFPGGRIYPEKSVQVCPIL